MIIVRLIGGLGNQLFQYAAGRSLAERHKTRLKLDISHYTADISRSYDLHHLSIQEDIATNKEIAEIKGISKRGILKFFFRLDQKIKPYYRKRVISEQSFSPFDPNILKTPKNLYLDGYWQSEKYFSNIELLIRREFIVRTPPSIQNCSLAKAIKNTQSVSVHVRRGDYISDPVSSLVHGICPPVYYERCIKFILENVPSAAFFVFSDDISWAMENLKLPAQITFVSQNDPYAGYEDFRLMSLCKYHIIANSSFSWWGAWLSSNPKKIVLAPEKWFLKVDYDTRDLIPKEWIQIPNY